MVLQEKPMNHHKSSTFVGVVLITGLGCLFTSALWSAPAPEESLPEGTIAAEPVEATPEEAAKHLDTSGANLKQIALAIHNHQQTLGTLPHNICDKDGKALLSWRVVISPYLGYDKL